MASSSSRPVSYTHLGTKTALSQEEFFAQVNKIGLSVIGQSEGIAVADKKMYALRDVTATVSCIPLIASSIMSKKLASGSDAILLDVTTGTGAFMKTVEQSIELAKLIDVYKRQVLYRVSGCALW